MHACIKTYFSFKFAEKHPFTLMTALEMVRRMKLGFLMLLITIIHSRSVVGEKTYIVRMDKSQMPMPFNHHFQWYDSILNSITHSPDVLYKYGTVMDGFSVRLTSEEAESLEKQTGVLSVMPGRTYKLHTTRTPEFLGLTHGRHGTVPPQHKPGTDQVIIGVIDTGIWPEHKSFDDYGLSPVPLGWKGSCDEGDNFTASSCNQKLIGARYFYKGAEKDYGPIKLKSARDYEGHGTHTSSTAAGSAVGNASLFGLALGVAQGMAVEARIAAYKVCWTEWCNNADVLAGMDAAIEDGVHIMSISLAGYPVDYYVDVLSIGAFTAMMKGIFVAFSAGNSGPDGETVTNIAPWITTVGAGTVDRDFPTHVTLGNGVVQTGVSLCNENPFMESSASLIHGQHCFPKTLNPSEVKGKVVVCDQVGTNPSVLMSEVVKDAGGVGMILANTEGEEVFAEAFLLPSVAVGKKAGQEIKNYIDSDPNATALISPATTKLGVQPSPVVTSFSSRGPNPITPDILKPDLIAPGVNILAAWPPAIGPTGFDFDKRSVSFNAISGTSMACPHVSGLAALIKGDHPDWSPAAIRSALMTTAYTVYQNGKPIIDKATESPATPFGYGSGHVDPMAALDPGLIYDASVDDYLGFLCAINYNASQIKSVTHRDFTCDPSKEYSLGDMNYPSFSVVLNASVSKVKYRRTVTNVGLSPNTYTVSVFSDDQLLNDLVSVEPSTLTFTKPNEKKSYTVTFDSPPLPRRRSSRKIIRFGALEWSDGKHKVRSPIAYTQNVDDTIPV